MIFDVSLHSPKTLRDTNSNCHDLQLFAVL
jgi:hypothetical protein